MKMRIRIGAILLAASFVGTFLTILFGCYPIKKHWQINPDPGSMQLVQKAVTSITYQEYRSLPTGNIEASGGRLNRTEHIDGFLSDVNSLTCRLPD